MVVFDFSYLIPCAYDSKMSNSVVKVTDPTLNDSLFLLVGEDGTVTPDRQTVESFLSK